MKPHPAHPLPAALESAVQRLKRAARDAALHTVESLGLAALSALSAQQREQMLAAQFELNRKLAPFAVAFNDALDEQLIRELGRRVDLELPASAASMQAADSMWDSLRLVDDVEVEAQISADRFAMDVAHGCEWELREVDAYLGSLLPATVAPLQRNPLRPELIGHALVKAIPWLSERAEVRKVLLAELGRSLGGLLRGSYASIVADWRQAGLRPASLAVRHRQQREGLANEESPAEAGASRRGGLGAVPFHAQAGAHVSARAGAYAEGPLSSNPRPSGFTDFSGFGEPGSRARTGFYRPCVAAHPQRWHQAAIWARWTRRLMSLIRRLALQRSAAGGAHPQRAQQRPPQVARALRRRTSTPARMGGRCVGAGCLGSA